MAIGVAFVVLKLRATRVQRLVVAVPPLDVNTSSVRGVPPGDPRRSNDAVSGTENRSPIPKSTFLRATIDQNELAEVSQEYGHGPWSSTRHGTQSTVAIDRESTQLQYAITNHQERTQFFRFDRSTRGEPIPNGYVRLRDRVSGEMLSYDEWMNLNWTPLPTSNIINPVFGEVPPGKTLELEFDYGPSIISAAFRISCPRCDRMDPAQIDVQFGFPDMLDSVSELEVRQARGESVTQEELDREAADPQTPERPQKVGRFDTDWIPLLELNVEFPASMGNLNHS